jgi:hypothetical protein
VGGGVGGRARVHACVHLRLLCLRSPRICKAVLSTMKTDTLPAQTPKFAVLLEAYIFTLPPSPPWPHVDLP